MKQSSSIQLDGDTIRYRSTTGNWDLPLSVIRIIGESTDQLGPFAVDYSLHFVAGPNAWHEASFYATGRDPFLPALESQLGAPLDLQLCNSTVFASRILWPPPLVGQPLFDYKAAPSKNWFGRFFGCTQVRQTDSELIRKYLVEKEK